jgi:hypothetical protein
MAAERDRSRFWLMHERAMERGAEPIVPATVLAQVRRSPAVAASPDSSKGAGWPDSIVSRRSWWGDLLGMAGRNDVVDAHVVVCCLLFGGTCVTSDDGDIRHLAEAARSDRQRRFGRTRLPIIPI